MEIRSFKGQNENVKKYVFVDTDCVYEAVIYKYPTYEERTVICCSVQSGCPVGCVFCGTGKRFIRNLNNIEIVNQIINVLEKEKILQIANNRTIKKFQIMFMSMGEPMLNWDEVEKAIAMLHYQYPNAQLLLSTMGINDDKTFSRIVATAYHINCVGLQFSLHNSIDEERNLLIPFKNKYKIREIRDRGIFFFDRTCRKPYINYCVTALNSTPRHIERMLDLFPPEIFCFTFSVICNSDRTKQQDDTDYTALHNMQNIFLENGYNVRIFDPAGKDDIGGGCGQLWYVQEWLKNKQYIKDREV